MNKKLYILATAIIMFNTPTYASHFGESSPLETPITSSNTSLLGAVSNVAHCGSWFITLGFLPSMRYNFDDPAFPLSKILIYTSITLYGTAILADYCNRAIQRTPIDEPDLLNKAA